MVTVNVSGVVPLVPTVTAALPTLTDGAGFGLLIVPTPVPSETVALVGDESTTVNDLGGLNWVVPLASTVIVCAVWPGAKVSVPLVAA